jgi:thiol-disulfide isomerase/thioredoxin
MNILNQFSYVVISLIILTASALVLLYLRTDRRVIGAAIGALLALMIAGYVLLRPGASDVANVSEATALIQNGKPTFMEFFSNYCAGCLAIRPVVDELAKDLGDEFNILRVDIHTDAGEELRAQYNFSYTPEFLLLNREGQEIWRGHNPPTQDQFAAVQSQLLGLGSP